AKNDNNDTVSFYDAEGNLTKKSKGASAETWTYGYDNLNHLTWSEDRSTDGGTLIIRVDFKYDVFGHMLEKDVTQGSTTVERYLNDGDMVLAFTDGSNALKRRHLYTDQIDGWLSKITSAAAVVHYFSDRLGSMRVLTNGSGVTQDVKAYDGF